MSLAVIGVFGFTLMDHSMMQHEGCVASVFTGGPCPTNQTIFAIHHIAAFQAFTSAILPPIFEGLLLALVLLALVLFFPGIYSPVPLRQFLSVRNAEDRLRLPDHSLKHWLALLELSPSFS